MKLWLPSLVKLSGVLDNLDYAPHFQKSFIDFQVLYSCSISKGVHISDGELDRCISLLNYSLLSLCCHLVSLFWLHHSFSLTQILTKKSFSHFNTKLHRILTTIHIKLGQITFVSMITISSSSFTLALATFRTSRTQTESLYVSLESFKFFDWVNWNTHLYPFSAQK